MYEQYWELTEKPFENTPDPRFIYHSLQHDEALALLIYAVTQGKGAALLTGDYGCGKTLTIHLLLETLYELDKDLFQISFIGNPNLSPSELIQQVLYGFGIKNVSANRVELLDALSQFLISNMNAGKRSLVVVDEAQTIVDEQTVDELRMLLNYQLKDRFLLTLVMVGQSEFARVVDSFPQFHQRIAVRCHLDPLSDFEEARAYIHHRLTVVGATREIFTEEAIQAIHEVSQGIPRQINNICDIALFMGFMRKVAYIDADMIRQLQGSMTATPQR